MSETWLRAAFLVCVFGAVLLAVEMAVGWIGRNRRNKRAMNQRLRQIGEGHQRRDEQELRRLASLEVACHLPPVLQPLGRRFDRMMAAAGLGVTPVRVLMAITIAPIALLVLAILVLLGSGASIGAGRLLFLATLALIVGTFVPLTIIQFRANRARRKMIEQFPIALDVFVRGLRAGHPVAAALELLTTEMPDPIGSQFGQVVDEVTYGADLRDALQAMAERWGLDDMRMFVVSLSVQRETGGNLAEVLENLTKVIRQRASMMMKVRALSSEGRMTALMLTALPLLALGGLFLVNPAFYLDVADDPAFIPGFVGLALLYVIGFVSIRRMVDLKV